MRLRAALAVICAAALAGTAASLRATRAAAASNRDPCHHISSCVECVKNPSCGWCPQSSKQASCRPGDEDGPEDTELTCHAWGFRGEGPADPDEDASVCEAAVVEEEEEEKHQEPEPRESDKSEEQEEREEREEEDAEEKQEQETENAKQEQEQEEEEEEAASDKADRLRDTLEEKQQALEEEEAAKASKVAESNVESQEKLDQYIAAKDLLNTAASQQAKTKEELHEEFKSLRELRAEENRRRHEEAKKKEDEEEEKFEEKRAERQQEESEKARPAQEEEQRKARELNAKHSENLNLVHDVSESRKLRRQDVRAFANAVKADNKEAQEVAANSDPEKSEAYVNQRLNGGILAKRNRELQEEKDCGCDQYDPHGIEQCMANCRQGAA